MGQTRQAAANDCVQSAGSLQCKGFRQAERKPANVAKPDFASGLRPKPYDRHYNNQFWRLHERVLGCAGIPDEQSLLRRADLARNDGIFLSPKAAGGSGLNRGIHHLKSDSY